MRGLEAIQEPTIDFKTFPILYKVNSKGQVQYWKVSVIPSSNHATAYEILTQYGLEGGKEQTSHDTVFEGKNIGRANETTPYEQACHEALGIWNKQVQRKGYVEDKNLLTVDQRPGAEPMLAHRYDKFPDKVTFPCAVQPKLDGHRCIAVFRNGVTKLFSRQRKPITGLPHIEAEITALLTALGTTELILDGELYNHDYKNKFEQLTSHIRSAKPKDGHTVVQYHVYDLMFEKPYGTRLAAIDMLFANYTGTVLQRVDTQSAATSEDVVEMFAAHRTQGYEGSMLRNIGSAYVPRRSYDLLKVKTFLDDEFKLIGVEDGRGKMAGHAIFVLQTEDGKEFRAKMKGTLASLADYFNNAEKYIGRIVTVQFQDWTADGIPRFPVALRFREDT